MGKGNYYFNANVGYILLEEFDEKFVSVLCIANNKKYSFFVIDILQFAKITSSFMEPKGYYILLWRDSI